jgi:hypothetical protein
MQRWKSSKRLPTAPSSDLPSKVVRGNQTIMESVSQPLLSGPPPQPAEMDPFRRPSTRATLLFMSSSRVRCSSFDHCAHSPQWKFREASRASR